MALTVRTAVFRVTLWAVTNVSEGHIASIFMQYVSNYLQGHKASQARRLLSEKKLSSSNVEK
jgi:hypothetical protein